MRKKVVILGNFNIIKFGEIIMMPRRGKIYLLKCPKMLLNGDILQKCIIFLKNNI